MVNTGSKHLRENKKTKRYWCHENKGNDRQLKRLSTVKEILLSRTLGNV